MTPLGPNVRKLIATAMAAKAIPTGGGLEAGLKFLSSKTNIANGFRAASEWTKQALQIVREAAEPNPWKTATDEEIAKEILDRIERREHGRHASEVPRRSEAAGGH